MVQRKYTQSNKSRESQSRASLLTMSPMPAKSSPLSALPSTRPGAPIIANTSLESINQSTAPGSPDFIRNNTVTQRNTYFSLALPIKGYKNKTKMTQKITVTQLLTFNLLKKVNIYIRVNKVCYRTTKGISLKIKGKTRKTWKIQRYTWQGVLQN